MRSGGEEGIWRQDQGMHRCIRTSQTHQAASTPFFRSGQDTSPPFFSTDGALKGGSQEAGSSDQPFISTRKTQESCSPSHCPCISAGAKLGREPGEMFRQDQVHHRNVKGSIWPDKLKHILHLPPSPLLWGYSDGKKPEST